MRLNPRRCLNEQAHTSIQHQAFSPSAHLDEYTLSRLLRIVDLLLVVVIAEYNQNDDRKLAGFRALVSFARKRSDNLVSANLWSRSFFSASYENLTGGVA